MGIHERDYYQDEQPRGFELSGQRSMVTTLVIITAALYVLDIFLGSNHSLMNHMAATPNSLAKPYLWWQQLTYGFAHSPADQWHIIWNMFALWMFGRSVEGLYGRKEFLRFYLVAIVIGGLVWTTRAYLTVDPTEYDWDNYRMLGASGAVTAVVLLFCLHFPKRQILLMFILPAPAWVLGVFIIVANLNMMDTPENKVAYDVHLAGAAFAFAYFSFRGNLGRWIPSFTLSTKWLKRRPKLKLHDPESTYDGLDEKADEVLEKVNRDGIESLNAKERRVLENYSRRMKQKHR